MRKLVLAVTLLLVLGMVPLDVGALPMDQSLASADVIFNAFSATGGLGTEAVLVGDVNGDGFDDILMSDHSNDTWVGNVYLVFGRESGWSSDITQANVTYWHWNQGDYLGIPAAAGDVNGDGFDDFLIGLPDADDPMIHAGEVHLFLGKAGGWNRYTNVSNSDATIRGTQMFEGVGRVVAGIGDVNGDGFDDFALSKYGAGPGWVYLFFGKMAGWNNTMKLVDADASYYGKEPKAFAGYDIDGGDVNGDGLDDIIIGAPGNDNVFENYNVPGDTYVVFGMRSGWQADVNLSDDANASFMGEVWDDHSGQAVSVAGDVNGDGFEDILIGTPLNDEIGFNSGKAYLMFGKASGWTTDFNLSNADASFRGESTFDQAGKVLSGAGDLNGDGISDFLLGAPINDDAGMTSQGQTYLYLGKTSGWTRNTNIGNADGSWLGEQTADWAPESLSGGADVNGDGRDDFIAGCQNMASRGKGYLFFPFKNKRPSEVTKVELFTDAGLKKQASYVDMGDKVYMKVTGTDADPANVSNAEVLVQSHPYDVPGYEMRVTETGPNTGIFVGNFTVMNTSQEELRFIKARPLSMIVVTSVSNNSANDRVGVGGGLVVELVTLQNNNDPNLYAEKKSYEFRARVNDTLGHGHIDHVNLSFPLATGKINYTWTYDTNSFQETSDPGFYARLDGASFTDLPSPNRTIIHFKVFFNFTFPDEMYHTVAVSAVSKDMDTDTKLLIDAYRVENDLDFVGDLEVRGKNNRLLHDGDVLSPAEYISFTNAMVVYQGTTDVVPPDGVFDVMVEDDDGNSWFDTQSSGAFFFIEAEATNGTDATEVLNVTIDGVPEESVNKSLTISLKVDGDQVSFSDPGPSSDVWQATKNVMASINITDTGGALVKGSSIDYRVKPDGGTWGGWTSASFVGQAPYIEAASMVNLNDGPANAIQWRATDGVNNMDAGGNKTESDVFAIKVDTVPPELSGAWPSETNVSKTLDVEFGIKVADFWAKVEGPSIEYTISTDDQQTWANWTNVGKTGTEALFVASATESFVDGALNWVRWRASDTLGNGPSLSEPINVVVDTTGPTPGNNEPVLDPLDDKVIIVGEAFLLDIDATDADGDLLYWELFDGPTGMTLTQNGVIRFTPTEADVGQYNVTIRVFDGLDDVFGTFKLRVILSRPSIAISNSDDLDGDLKGKVTVNGIATPGVGDIEVVEYNIDGVVWIPAIGNTDWSFTFDTKDLEDGDHVLTIRAKDGASTSDELVRTITVKNKKKVGPPGGEDLLASLMFPLIIVVAIIVVVVLVLVMTRRKKGPTPPTEQASEQGQQQQPTTVGPPGQQQMYQPQQQQPQQQYQPEQQPQAQYQPPPQQPPPGGQPPAEPPPQQPPPEGQPPAEPPPQQPPPEGQPPTEPPAQQPPTQ